MQIKYSENVVGCRIGEDIYLNPNLESVPELRAAILEHEKGHTGRFSMKDLFMDIDNKELRGVKFEYWKFILNNPKSLLGFLPVTRIDKEWSIDIPILLIWILAIAVRIITWRIR